MKRWYVFAIIGLVFGILDWFYLDCLANISWGALSESKIVIPIILLLNYGIWLVPILPAVIFTARKGNKIWDPIVIGIVTWLFALLGYYLFYAILLSLGLLPHLEHLNIFSGNASETKAEYWDMFKRIISDQFLEWIPVAVVGGLVLGAFAWWIFRTKVAEGDK